MRTVPNRRIAAACWSLALGAGLGLTGCGDPSNGVDPGDVEPVVSTSTPVDAGTDGDGTDEPAVHKTAAPNAVHFESELVFTKRQFSVLSSITTYQGNNLCRWTLQPVGEGAASQTMTFRWNDQLFQRAPEQVKSVQLDGTSATAKMRELELLRAAMFWPDSPRGLQAWNVQDGDGKGDRVKASSTLQLLTAAGEDLGTVEMTYDELGADGTEPVLQVFRLETAGEADANMDDGTSLVIYERFDSANRSWPKRMTLVVDDEPLWTQTVTSLNVQSWFGEKFFLPLEQQGRVDATGQ